MKLKDFTNAGLFARWLQHETLPFAVYVSLNNSETDWYYLNDPKEGVGITCMEELKDRKIEDVTDEEISLYLLKYSNL